MQAPLDIEYKIDTTKSPMHLDIHHTAYVFFMSTFFFTTHTNALKYRGLLGVGIEKCIFELKENGNVLVIASPQPTDDPERFGPRPLSFDCAFDGVSFYVPDTREVVKSRARDSVKDMTDNEQLYNFFKSTADLYDENVQGVRKIINLGHEGQSMEQLLMVQHLQIATKLRNIEMKYDRVFAKVKAIIEKGDGSEYGENVESERDRFMKNLQKMQNIQYALKLMAEQQERVQKQQSSNAPSDIFDPLPSSTTSSSTSSSSSSSQQQQQQPKVNAKDDASKTIISNQDKKEKNKRRTTVPRVLRPLLLQRLRVPRILLGFMSLVP